MRRVLLAGTVLALCVLAPAVIGQRPDLGAVGTLVDGPVGTAVAKVLPAAYNATGQNITREDVRLFLDLNFTKGEVGLAGLLVGAGKAEVQAHLRLKAEMRAISSDRIRAAINGEDAYNMSAENATFLQDAYIPADVFRASLTAEAIALFQKAQEAALGRYLEESVPEMEVLSLEIRWSNVAPQKAFTDTDLKEPPIIVQLDLVVQYIRIESLGSLLESYLASHADPHAKGKSAYVEKLKLSHGAEPKKRDFMGAAAYTQLLNLSMQPGWKIDVGMNVPRGYSFTYFNEPVARKDKRSVAFQVDAHDKDAEIQSVMLASITHRRGVILALFVAVWIVGLVAAAPVRFVYSRRRLPKVGKEKPKAARPRPPVPPR